MGGKRFTEPQNTWLRENYRNAKSYDALTKLFNETFHEAKSKPCIRERCTERLGLHGMPNASQYGCKQKEQLPIGTIRKSQTGTYIKVRELKGTAKITGYSKPYWVPVQEKIWTDAHGDLGDGQFVTFLNGDTNDFALENLYPIDRRISIIMTSNGWWSKNRTQTMTAIRWCELYYALKKIGG